MKFKFLICIFFFYTPTFASDISSMQIIGCNQRAINVITQVTSEVDIANAYLEKNENKSDIINEQIEAQIKHWIGISKKFSSSSIKKMALSAYRNNLKILDTSLIQNNLPTLDAYWNNNIHYGENPYIKYLLTLKPENQKYARIKYQIDLAFSICADQKSTDSDIITQLESIPLPRDPLLTYWINSKTERSTRQIKGVGSGIVPNCISDDFLIYGTSPHYGWFYWEPRNESLAVKCEISQAQLITKMSIKVLSNLNPNKHEKVFSQDAKITGSVIFGVVENPSLNTSDKILLLSEIKARFDQCAKLDINDCIQTWSNIKGTETGQRNLLSFLQYTSALFSKIEFKVLKSDSKFFIIQLNAISKFSKKLVQIDLYHGPTSTFKSLLAPTEYWNFVKKTLYKSDFLVYFGHAGLGDNLDLKTIQKFSVDKKNYAKRSTDLNLGIFNCEGFSYYGFGYSSLFKNDSKAPNHEYILSSSGVEVRSHFLLGYIEQLLNGNINNFEVFKKAMAAYVKSQDFLNFQSIKI
jgi:hypothetical protein